jgi:hypothetical protein
MRRTGKPRPVPLTPAEAERRAAALRDARAPKPSSSVASIKPSAPESSNVRSAELPGWVAAAAPKAPGGLRLTATISITMIDRAARSRSDVIRAAIEALQDAQGEGAADEMIEAAHGEGFDVERIELLATEPEARS